MSEQGNDLCSFSFTMMPCCSLLKSESPLGPFVPHSNGVVTPEEWECLDGTLYINREGKPYIVFCHEHTQILDGTICRMELSDDLTHAVEEPVELFAASSFLLSPNS